MDRMWLFLTKLFNFIKNLLISKLIYILLLITFVPLALHFISFEDTNIKYDDLNLVQGFTDKDLTVKNFANEERRLRPQKFDEYDKILTTSAQENEVLTTPSKNDMSIENLEDTFNSVHDLTISSLSLSDQKLKNHFNELKKIQNETLTYWYQMDVPEKIKWSALASIHDPLLLKYTPTFQFTSDGELKHFLKFNDKNEPNCNIYTLGIGFDYSGEEKLFKKYPQCKLTGVDPEERINKDLVEKVPNARFIKATIGAKDGTYTASVRQMNKKYKSVTVEHIGIANFFQKYNGNKTIDMIIIDVEGAEFELLPVLVEEKEKLPTICQINVEVHYPPENYGFTHEQALENVYKFFNDGTYTVFNFELFLQMMRVFVINTSSEECLKKFRRKHL